MNRPKPGSITIEEVRIKMCKSCGYPIGETGLCSRDCELDGDEHSPEQYFLAVVKVITEFLRDEPS